MTTPAAELRTAAQTLRKLANDATPGPWRTHDTHLDLGGHTATVMTGKPGDGGLLAWVPTMSHAPWTDGRNAWNNAEYIAAMHPGVGAALAKLLREAHALHEPKHCPDAVDGCHCAGCGWCGDEDWPCSDVRNALAVARQILGSQP
ncbi:hypothetical protein [Streptomyces sp. NPDC101145]|uniref:hypothetical protein n=1 Tax=Streptomyces sp. NPDC101145 TaxID=3366112 RepID=UPI0037F63DEE